MTDVQATLAERGARYGDFTDHAAVCQKIKMAYLYGPSRWAALSDVQKQALEVIADKIARILTGDPNYDDNWHDIQGYARLVEERLPGSKIGKTTGAKEPKEPKEWRKWYGALEDGRSLPIGVDSHAPVMVKLRNGTANKGLAEDFRWAHSGASLSGFGFDIVDYCVVPKGFDPS